MTHPIPQLDAVWRQLGIPPPTPGALVSTNPSTGLPLAALSPTPRALFDATLNAARDGFLRWRLVPAPVRGALVKRLGELFAQHKDALGMLITLEVGKITSEGRGEVQEMVDICEFAVGLSRQLHGLTMPSERAQHRLMEQWHPLGVVGVVTAFNFPMAVWAWNAALAAVCGDTVMWKPSPHAPLCAYAVHALCERAMRECAQPDVFHLVQGDRDVATWMAQDTRLPLLSFTGSTEAGRTVGVHVAQRLGRSLLELGGNNAVVVHQDADLELATRSIAFGALGTAGQRCTTTRRVLCHHTVVAPLLQRLEKAFASARCGEPWRDGVLVGPLITAQAVQAHVDAVKQAVQQGARLVCGGNAVGGAGHFVEPALLHVPAGVVVEVAARETFSPVLYVFEVASLEDAVVANNAVAHGLSSAIFTDSVRAAEFFVGPAGSDCGLANVNVGTSGAEIGGAFGGEKDTGGGRESGSDAWKAYMRRQTCTLNGGKDLPLAQGVVFG